MIKGEFCTFQVISPFRLQRLRTSCLTDRYCDNFYRAKCKFSHDLTVDRKTAKKDLYTDGRDPSKETGAVPPISTRL